VTKSRFSHSQLVGWLAWIAFAVVDALLVWAPGDGDQPGWLVPALTAFVLFFLLVLLSASADQSLGRRMQMATEAGSGDVPAETDHEVRHPQVDAEAPVPPFAIEVITAENLPPLSPAAQAFVHRGRSYYRERLRIYRQGVWFLMMSHIAIAWMGSIFDSPYPLSAVVVTWVLATFLALIVLAPPDRIRLMLVPGVWWILVWACVAVTAVLAARYGSRGLAGANVASLLLALGAIVAIAAHIWRTRRRNEALRRRVMAAPPVHVLFLWVFASQSPALLFLGFAAVWRFLGRIQLLNGAGFMGDSVDIVKSVARGKSADLVVKTPEELAERVRAFERAPNRMAMYPHNSLLCNDTVWKLALDTLLDKSDVVLMDLRGFSPVNRGATYELGHLIDRFPTARLLLLADETTDMQFLTESLRLAWESMAAGSPNRRASSAPVRVFHLPRAVGQEGQFPQLFAIAREGDRLVELLCERAVAS